MLIELKKFKDAEFTKGMYLAKWEFNFNHELNMQGIEIIDEYEPIVDKGERYIMGYGVCDNYEQILEHVPEIISSKENYVIGLTLVNKKDESTSGGWRWHKWGEYIGNQNPQEEYLYDEPEIEKVYCYSIYKIK